MFIKLILKSTVTPLNILLLSNEVFMVHQVLLLRKIRKGNIPQLNNQSTTQKNDFTPPDHLPGHN